MEEEGTMDWWEGKYADVCFEATDGPGVDWEWRRVRGTMVDEEEVEVELGL